MKNSFKILIIDGDDRQKYIYNYLLEEGFNVTLKENNEDSNYDAIILPLGYKDINNIVLSAGTRPIFAGRISPETFELANNKNVEIYDYFENEETKYKNAILTAEAAIAIAIDEYKKALRDCNCLIIGFGRIGKILAKLLYGFTYNICISARKEKDLSYIDALGFDFCNTNKIKNISSYDIIFNTVPNMVIGKELLTKVKKDVYIIDLASSPGGIDFKAAEELGIKFNHALSLPGKYSPISAGLILGASISKILKERS